MCRPYTVANCHEEKVIVRKISQSRAVDAGFGHTLSLPSTTTLAIMSPSAFLDVSKTSFFLSLGSITFNPTGRNILARNGEQEPSRRLRLPFSKTSLTTLKNTTTRQSPALSVETLIWVVTSSPYAFSVREYYGITCALTPRFSFLSPPFSSSIRVRSQQSTPLIGILSDT